MKFYSYINETNDTDKIIDIMIKKCKPFLNEIKNIPDVLDGKYYLYSGRDKNDKYFTQKIRKDRQPLNTPKEVHDFLDKHFQKIYGIKLRSNSLFCTLNRSDASSYGSTYIIFPIGKYKIFFNPNVLDMVYALLDITGKAPVSIKKEDVEKHEDEIIDVVQGYIEGVPSIYTDAEIMLYGSEYLAIDHSFWVNNNMDDKLNGILRTV